MWLSGISGHGGLVSQWDSTIKSAWVCTVANQYPLFYYIRCCQDANTNSQQLLLCFGIAPPPRSGSTIQTPWVWTVTSCYPYLDVERTSNNKQTIVIVHSRSVPIVITPNSCQELISCLESLDIVPTQHPAPIASCLIGFHGMIHVHLYAYHICVHCLCHLGYFTTLPVPLSYRVPFPMSQSPRVPESQSPRVPESQPVIYS